MFGKLNHLAITSDNYTLLGMFYRAAFGLKASGDTAREIGAISVGDGYVGMTLIPRRGGRKAGLDHFGIEVADLDTVRDKVARKYPDIEIVKRPRPAILARQSIRRACAGASSALSNRVGASGNCSTRVRASTATTRMPLLGP